MKNILWIILFACSTSCVQTGTNGETPEGPDGNSDSTIVSNEVQPDSVLIVSKANTIVGILKKNQLGELVPFIHPEKGLRFSPYATVDTADIVVFVNDISSLSRKEVKNWGVYDGSGESMDLTFDEYHQKFIYDYDFADADSVFYNLDRQYGNSINNIREIYPEGKTVEYYISGKEGEYTGFEWRALRLVFEKTSDEWFLTGIVHSEWTI